MDLGLISRVLFLRAAWRRRDHWDAAQITAHQDHALRELRRATYAGSEFYRRHHADLHDAPLDQLPVAAGRRNSNGATARAGVVLAAGRQQASGKVSRGWVRR